MGAQPAPERSNNPWEQISERQSAHDTIPLSSAPQLNVIVLNDSLIIYARNLKEHVEKYGKLYKLKCGQRDKNSNEQRYYLAIRDELADLNFIGRDRTKCSTRVEQLSGLVLKKDKIAKKTPNGIVYLQIYVVTAGTDIFRQTCALPNPKTLNDELKEARHLKIQVPKKVNTQAIYKLEEYKLQPQEEKEVTVRKKTKTKAKKSAKASDYQKAKRHFSRLEGRSITLLLKRSRHPFAKKLLKEAKVYTEKSITKIHKDMKSAKSPIEVNQHQERLEEIKDIGIKKIIARYTQSRQTKEERDVVSWLCNFCTDNKDNYFARPSTKKARQYALPCLERMTFDYRESVNSTFKKRLETPDKKLK